MAVFADRCRRLNGLARLSSITFTVPVEGMIGSWFLDLERLLWDSPLVNFHLYVAGGQVGRSTDLDRRFVEAFCSRHGDRLARFAVLRWCMNLDILETVARHCQGLEQLFIAIRRRDLASPPYLVSFFRVC